jgi:integrase
MDAHWGPEHAEPRTYNSNLSVVKDFFKHLAARGELVGDPTLAIERVKARDPHRETFTTDQIRAIVASQEHLRDRIELRLLLNYALRKGSLRAVRFKHFDHVRKTLTVFAKGGTVRTLPIPDPAFWHDLERLILDTEAEPSHYLMPGRRGTGTARGSCPGHRSRTTGCTTGGTGASHAPASSPRGSRQVSGCTRRATPPARSYSTAAAT